VIGHDRLATLCCALRVVVSSWRRRTRVHPPAVARDSIAAPSSSAPGAACVTSGGRRSAGCQSIPRYATNLTHFSSVA